MENKPRKKILLLITNPVAATNVIHSGLIKLLVENYEIHLLSDIISEKNLDEINQHFSITLHRFKSEIQAESVSVRLGRKLQKALFFRYFNIETQSIKERNDAGIPGNFIRLILNSVHKLRLDGTCLKALRLLIINWQKASFKDVGDIHFDGIISTSPMDIRENWIVNGFSRNVRSLAIVISWDNLTSKGVINAEHDYILVWNKFMEAEYLRFYKDYGKLPEVRVTGIPRFDLYFNTVSETKIRAEFLALQERKTILFATSAVKHFPTQVDIVHHLLEYAQTRPEILIQVRCHPGDDFSLYRALGNQKNIKIWFQQPLNVAEIPRLDVLSSLARMLFSCDVCVQIASTMRLDAAACNKPIISIAYDGDEERPNHQSVRRFYDYTHQLPLNKLHIDTMVHDKLALFQTLDDHLNKVNHCDNRNKIQEFIHFSEAESVPAIMNAIAQWLD